MRLAGDLIQTGDTLVPGANSSTIASGQEPVLVPLADGRWTVRLQFYAGTVLRYKYTWRRFLNGELDANGSRGCASWWCAHRQSGGRYHHNLAQTWHAQHHLRGLYPNGHTVYG